MRVADLIRLLKALPEELQESPLVIGEGDDYCPVLVMVVIPAIEGTTSEARVQLEGGHAYFQLLKEHNPEGEPFDGYAPGNN